MLERKEPQTRPPGKRNIHMDSAYYNYDRSILPHSLLPRPIIKADRPFIELPCGRVAVFMQKVGSTGKVRSHPSSLIIASYPLATSNIKPPLDGSYPGSLSTKISYNNNSKRDLSE